MRRVFFVLSIDTEEEWDWKGPLPQSPFSTRNAERIPAFQELCRELGIRPTYLVDYAICADPESAACLRAVAARGPCEIGAHLHPWCTPPLAEGGAESCRIFRLPETLVREKLRNLTAKIEETL